MQTVSITPAQAERMRQWFDAVQGINPGCLEAADYELAARLYESLGLRVPNSIAAQLERARLSRYIRNATGHSDT